VQDALRSLFEQWGLPARIRVDNGMPWGNGSDLPPALALWFVGLGVGVIWNPPRSPTHNAKVERQNGTVARWGEPLACADFAAWEAKLLWVARVQREEYPAVGGQSRLSAHPKLQTPTRPYRRAEEAQRWELARVSGYLAQGVWPRQVSKRGQISLYGKAYQVGAAQGGERVWVRLDGERREWVVQGGDGQEKARHAADQITAERIRGMQVAKPHASSKAGRKRRNLPSEPATVLYAA
jgi:hypothetical protein